MKRELHQNGKLFHESFQKSFPKRTTLPLSMMIKPKRKYTKNGN
jgi:hypothetical protein